MTTSWKWITRDETLLLFDRPDTPNFRSALQVQRVGDHAQIHSLHGGGFYELLTAVGLTPFRERGIRFVQAAMTPEHAVLVRRRLRQIEGAVMHDAGTCRIDGQVLRWVLIADEIGIAQDEEEQQQGEAACPSQPVTFNTA